MTPSESRLASQKKAEGPVTSASGPSMEASAPQGATVDAPAPMETGSHSKRWEVPPTLPFPLQDKEGRHTSVQQLYVNAGQQPPAPHNVATVGILRLHLEVLPRVARSIGNQVLCMIAEYHLTSQVQGTPNLSPVLLEVAGHLLPPVEGYVGGGGFQGMRDMRVVKRAKTLRIAAWLHCLDMVAEGDVSARRP